MINAFKQIRLTNYGVSGANGRLNVNASGLAYYSELTGVSGVIQTNIASTGSSLQGQITSLSGTLTGQYLSSLTASSTYATVSNLATTGGVLTNKIDSLSGTLTSTYATASNLATTGGVLTNKIDSLSGTLTGTYLLSSTASTTYATAANLKTTGDNLQGQISNLGNTYVTLGTNQTISGVKTFTNSVYIKDLYVTGTQTIVNTQVTNVGSNYLNLNATGGARDAGLFINLSTGANTSGAYIGFDVPSNTFRIGTGVSGLADLSVLDIIATQAYVSNFTASATSGAVLMTNVAQTISGDKTFVNALNLQTQATTTNHAVRADRSINNGIGLIGGGNLTADRTLSIDTNVVVTTTGTQTISGDKTFSNAVTLSTQATTTSHAVRADRNVYGGSGLSPGGNLTSDVTLNVGKGYGINVNPDNIEIDTSQVVVITGSQTITGPKTFNDLRSNTLFSEAGSFSLIDTLANNLTVLNLSEGNTFFLRGPTGNSSRISFYEQGVDNPYITGFSKIWATNIYQGINRVIDSSQTGIFVTTGQTGTFATAANLVQTGSTLQTQINSLSGTLTGTYVTTQFANATYATLVALNQKINWVSGQSQAFTNTVTTGIDTQFIAFPAVFTGGTIPTVQVTLDIPSWSDYMYNVAVRGVSTSGFTALYSDVILETGVILNVWASKLYGSI